MNNAYPSNTDTTMTWDIFQHQEQVMRQAAKTQKADDSQIELSRMPDSPNRDSIE